MVEFPINVDNRYGSKRDWLSNLLIYFLAIVFILLLLFNSLYDRIYVVGSSMQDTLTGATSVNRAGGDYVYICKYIEPDYGDIVVIDVGDKNLIKRVIAFGGDSVRLDNGVLYLKKKADKEEQLVEEPYVSPDRNTDSRKNTFSAISVPKGCVFCMGDNRDNSDDSRGKYGCMPIENITGVVTGWSMQCKAAVTGWNTFFDFTLPEMFGN